MDTRAEDTKSKNECKTNALDSSQKASAMVSAIGARTYITKRSDTHTLTAYGWKKLGRGLCAPVI